VTRACAGGAWSGCNGEVVLGLWKVDGSVCLLVTRGGPDPGDVDWSYIDLGS
jgi:hypothetical protein